MNKPQRYHNPGDLMLPEPRGEAIAVHKNDPSAPVGICEFPNDPAGWRALVRQIKADQRRGETIEGFIAGTRTHGGFAPRNDNDTERYITVLCRELRAFRTDKLERFSPYCVAAVVALQEGYFNA